MKRILFGFMAVVFGAWLASWLLLDTGGDGYFYWVRQLLILTGVLAFATMAAVMLLALRLPAVERALGGLDKCYQLHKYGGISAAVLLGLHWLLQQSKHWVIDLGWLTVGGRGPGPHGTGFNLRGLAESVGEWAFYALLALVLISLLQQIGYRRFRLVHKAAGVIFLAGAFHSLILMPEGWLLSPAGLVTLVAAATGSLVALYSLSGHIGRRRRQTGQLTRITPLNDQILEVEIRLTRGWTDYRAGQFAFVSFEADEGPHPFTVVRYQPEQRLLTFAIKALGDYTGKLAGRLKCNQPVEVEGPYGQFHHTDKGASQIWIGAGVGITPFVAWLESLVKDAQPAPDADLYYCVRSRDQAVYGARLQALCQRLPSIRLHLLVDDEDPPLSADRILAKTRALLPDIWFCGPSGFAKTLLHDLQRFGLPRRRFHRELFEMR